MTACKIPAGAVEQDRAPAPAGHASAAADLPPVALTPLDLGVLRHIYTLRAPALRRLLDTIEGRQPVFSP